MEVKIGAFTYRGGRLDARKQFHVGLKIAPAYAALAVARARAAEAMPKPKLVANQEPKEGEEEQTEDDAAANVAMAEMFKAMADAFASMSEADVNFILNSCLSVVERQEGTVWGKVIASNGGLMFEKDMDFQVMMRLAMEVIKENLGPFFAAPWAVLG